MNSVDHDLRLVREGTDYFSRRLDALTDADFDGPSLLPGWDRRHVVAHVGYNADALTRLVTWAGTGTETPMYASQQARDDEIDAGATMTPMRSGRCAGGGRIAVGCVAGPAGRPVGLPDQHPPDGGVIPPGGGRVHPPDRRRWQNLFSSSPTDGSQR